jgi:predicted RNA polymerase sigma factor
MLNAKTSLAAIILLPVVAAAQDAADSVLGMCVGLGTPEACECAAEALREEIGDADYALYEGVGADYLARMAGGEGRASAWTSAVETAAAAIGQSRTTLMTRTNEIGSTHSAAIKACSG